MPTQIDLDGGSEPAQTPAVGQRPQKRRLGEIHLAGDGLHPGFVGGAIEWADGGRVAAKGLIGKRIGCIYGD
jgi:hypothetical protein